MLTSASLDGSPDERLALDWKKEAVRSFFCFPSGEWDVTRPPRKSLLTTTIYQEADRVSNMGGISCALHELSRVPSLWNTKSFTYLADVRMSFCDEVSACSFWRPTVPTGNRRLKITSGPSSSNGKILHYSGIRGSCNVSISNSSARCNLERLACPRTT